MAQKGVDEPDEEAGAKERNARRAPESVRGAAAIVALEGVGVVALGVLLLVRGILMSEPDSLSRAWAEVVIAVAAGVGMAALARALSRGALWSRGPVVVIQLLALPIGYSVAVPSEQVPYGVAIMAAAASVLYLLATPEARVAFMQRR